MKCIFQLLFIILDTLNKNNLSISIIIKLLKSISWINIHKLPVSCIFTYY